MRTDVAPIGLLGAPTSAGSHNAGQEKAPAALRAAGLVDRLRAAGREVRDFGDLPTHRHRPTPVVEGTRALDRVATAAREVADAVSDVVAAEHVPLVLGGDCTITLGVVAGLARHVDIGLVYLDGDADLSTPASSGTGVLDSMGVSHLLGNGTDELSALGERHPLLRPEQIALLGFDPGELDERQWVQLVARSLHATPAPAVRTDPVAAAMEAKAHVAASAEAVLVHFDVDVIDTGQFPLANFPHFAGLSPDEALLCLGALCCAPDLAGLVITEVNPDHDPDGELLDRLLAGVVAALAS